MSLCIASERSVSRFGPDSSTGEQLKRERNEHAPPNPVLILTSSIVCWKLPASVGLLSLQQRPSGMSSQEETWPRRGASEKATEPTHLAERIDSAYRKPPAHFGSVPSVLRLCL